MGFAGGSGYITNSMQQTHIRSHKTQNTKHRNQIKVTIKYKKKGHTHTHTHIAQTFGIVTGIDSKSNAEIRFSLINIHT